MICSHCELELCFLLQSYLQGTPQNRVREAKPLADSRSLGGGGAKWRSSESTEGEPDAYWEDKEREDGV